MELTSLDLYYIVKELKEIEGAIVSNIYQPKDLIISLHKEGKHFLNISDNYLFLDSQKAKQKEPTPFVMFLRKHLDRARLVKVEQVRFERVLLLEFSKSEGEYRLYLELFSRGNSILTDGDDKILIVRRSESFKDRTLKRGEEYKLPPEKVDTSKISFAKFEGVLDEERRSTVLKTLAIEFSLGGKYATEVCKRLGISNSDVKVKDKKELFDGIKELFTQRLNPNVGEYVNPFILVSDPPLKSFENFSSALKYYSSKVESEKESPSVLKYRTMIEKQEETLKETEEKIQKLEEQARLIFSNLKEIQFIIDRVNQEGWGVTHPLIKEKRPEKKEIVIEIK